MENMKNTEKIENAETNAGTGTFDVEAFLEAPVKLRLFRDGDRYRDSMYVAINGQNCLISRGEWIWVKRKYALVLDQSEIQDMRTASLQEMEQDRFREAEAKLA